MLAHWHPFTYGQGDMLASVGPLRYMSLPTSVSDRHLGASRPTRTPGPELAPLARTRYLLCPIGMDFVHPIRGLLELIDHYNAHSYPTTGLWVTNAGADDYLDLVDEHRCELPVLELDPNPYWTGFYSSRPELKRSHRLLVDELVGAEAAAVADGVPGATRVVGDLADAWWTAAVGNHHDFVTGTSPDRVVRGEQSRGWTLPMPPCAGPGPRPTTRRLGRAPPQRCTTSGPTAHCASSAAAWSPSSTRPEERVCVTSASTVSW